MYLFLCAFFAFLCIVRFPSAESNSQSDTNYKFLGRYPSPKITQSPIDISCKEAKNVSLSPVILRGVVSDRVKVINTGRSVTYIVDQPETNSVVTGGPFLNEKYKFKKARFYWVNEENGVAATTVDGKDGTPIEKIVYFYNIKYKSFTNALKYRDGIAQISYRINITETENPLFPEFGEKLKQIRQPGSSATTTLGTAFKWYNSFPPSTSYFAYPGSYTDERTQQQYFCSTVIVLPHYPNMYLSKKQFDETFGSLKNMTGSTLTNKSPQYSRTMPVVQSKKIIQYIVTDQNGSSWESPEENTKPCVNDNEEESEKQNYNKTKNEHQAHGNQNEQQLLQSEKENHEKSEKGNKENQNQHEQQLQSEKENHEKSEKENEESQNQHEQQLQSEKENHEKSEKENEESQNQHEQQLQSEKENHEKSEKENEERQKQQHQQQLQSEKENQEKLEKEHQSQ